MAGVGMGLLNPGDGRITFTIEDASPVAASKVVAVRRRSIKLHFFFMGYFSLCVRGYFPPAAGFPARSNPQLAARSSALLSLAALLSGFAPIGGDSHWWGFSVTWT
jgi:hypothetical protein